MYMLMMLIFDKASLKVDLVYICMSIDKLYSMSLFLYVCIVDRVLFKGDYTPSVVQYQCAKSVKPKR